MGITFIEGTVTGPSGKKATLRFLIDSGATYTVLPEPVRKELGLRGNRRESFVLTDGTFVDREVSECKIQLAERGGHTPVILGYPGDEALLGVITLENLGLILNPFSRTLQKMNLRLG